MIYYVIDYAAIQEKARKEYEKKKGEFIHPLDWRHHSHDIMASPEVAERTVQPMVASSYRLDGLQAEIRHAVNKINEHIDASRKRGDRL